VEENYSMTTPLHIVPYSELQRISSLNSSAVARTSVFANACRLNTLSMIKRAGSGHIGSCFSSLDIVSWLHLNEMRLPSEGAPDAPKDIYFSSKGHDVPALYAVMAGCGLLPFPMLATLRQIGGLPGHPDVGTPNILTNTGSLGMGVAKAKGMAFANRQKGNDGRIYVLTGDGELQEGQFWESLSSTVNAHLGEITVIIDHNKIQSDTWVEKTSDLGDLFAKLSSFGWHVKRCDGHDLSALAAALKECKSLLDQPSVIIADTIKGRGVSFFEPTAMKPDEWRYLFHSGAPDDETYAKAARELIETTNAQLAEIDAAPLSLESFDARVPARPSPREPQHMVPAYSKALLQHAERDPSIVALDADLILDTGLIPFREQFPERFIECGIAEQDMVSQAGGMALLGLVPVVHSFACFLSTRPNEQIYNNATEGTKIIYVGTLAGVVPGGPGHSHQSVRDISALAAMPGLVMLEPCCEVEVAETVSFCIETHKSSSYIRLVSIPCEVPFELPENYRLELGKGVTIADGSDAVLFAYGPVMLANAWQARKKLDDEHGVSLKIVNMPWLNRVDHAWLADTVADFRFVFTVDNHYLTGGQGEMLACALGEIGALGDVRMARMGLSDIPQCGTNEEVLTAHGLDAGSIAERIAGTVL
jgi:transketolase